MNNKGVSAVVGVILMVAITVGIACTVYVYVNDVLIDVENEQLEYISGNLTNIQHLNENNFFIMLDNDSYILTFDKYEYTQYSFTIDNFYMFRVDYSFADGNTYIRWVVEINAVQ